MRKGISTTTRLTVGLTSIAMSVLFMAHQLGFMPDPMQERLQGRARLCEAVAIWFSIAAQSNQRPVMAAAANLLTRQNDDILSVAVLDARGNHITTPEKHEQLWQSLPDQQSVATHIQIPLLKGGKSLGTLQICFQPLALKGIRGLLARPIVRTTGLLFILGGPLFWLYLRRTFRYLDPAKVIPDRVKAILDTMSEGVLVLDKKEQIVLANEAFFRATGHNLADLQGRKVTDIAWQQPRLEGNTLIFPWSVALREGQRTKGLPLALQNSAGENSTFVVNSTPIRSADGKIRGALVTFDDVSEIEEKNTKLENALTMLNESRDKIKRQNEELRQLSIQDPLTGCSNRRAFFEILENEWDSASHAGAGFGCIMLDIDHFKQVNDTHGHAKGDQVLQALSQILRTAIRDSDCVCRYGGEEFCMLIRRADVAETFRRADELRCRIETAQPGKLPVTASLGVSAFELQAEGPHQLIDQADKALYAAKHTGRNRVVRWDQMPDETALPKTKVHHSDQLDTIEHPVHISFSAVKALMAALEYRDVTTAVHSRNVADLCVAMGKGLMPESDRFILEIAGLLHDVGKLGVPDSILLKPGPLTDEEWKIMSTHDRMGVEIINACFGSAELTNIVRHGHAWYGGSPRDPGLPTGEDIPLRSRILLIADAYDAMTSDRVYRKAMTREAAFAELRRSAYKQFDPELIERFIEVVQARDGSRHAASPSADQAKALKIGLEIERLACAMEAQDVTLLAAIADRLVQTAAAIGLDEIARVAGALRTHTQNKRYDTACLIECTNELIELCRSHQHTFLAAPEQKTQPPTNG
jgi:diguanylate cyclase (GGDEF)-like protein/PAS domain S-box-containing protein